MFCLFCFKIIQLHILSFKIRLISWHDITYSYNKLLFRNSFIIMKNLRLHKNLLHQLILTYLKRDFIIMVNLKNEYSLEKNIVSGKYVIVPTFSKLIDSNIELKLSLYNVIQHINHTITSISALRKAITALKH